MNEFLDLNPKFAQDAKLLKQITRKIVFRNRPALDTYLPLIKLPLFKKLLARDFYKSTELRKVYKEIIKKESNGVEKMIFKVLCGKSITFSDVTLKFLFYKEFPEKKGFFLNEKATVMFEVEDLLFRKIYFHEDTVEHLQKMVQNSDFKLKIFLILALKGILNLSFIRDTIFNIKEAQTTIKMEMHLKDHEFLEYWVLLLRSLPEKEFYAIVTSEMVYSPLVEKIRLFRSVEKSVNHEKLSLFILRECLNSPLLTVKIYVVFLKLIEMMTLSYDFKIRLLYSWLRYFLYERRLDLFFGLMEKLRHVKRKDKDHQFYSAMEKYLNGEIGFEEVGLLSNEVDDRNQFSSITIKEIISKYNESETKRRPLPP